MRCLFFDIASHETVVACCTDKEVAACITQNGPSGDGELMTYIHNVLKRAQWQPEELTGVAAVMGPGGFTSLRIAAAGANALGFALSIAVCGMHLSELYRARSQEKDLLWLHSTKRSEVFIRGFGRWQQQWSEAVHCELGSVLEVLQSESITDCTWTGELLEEHQQAIAPYVSQQAALVTVESILPSLLAEQRFSQQTLQPWYGREG